MTTLETSITTIDECALAAAQAAAVVLPAAEAWSVHPVAADGSDLLPDPAARAVVASVGSNGTLVLLAAPVLARQVQVGPPPAEDLAEGATAALTAAAAALPPLVDGAVPEGISEVDPVSVLAGDGELAALRLLDGELHLATLIVQVASPTTEEPATAAFEPMPAAATTTAASELMSGLELLHDVEMGVTVELGRARMLVRDVLSLSPGSVVELDRAAGSPVDVLVNGTLIARGEVVVIDEEFGVRITEVIGHRPERPTA
jgi:flagellar motor switch protein FliN